MKKYFRVALFLISILFLFSSCSSENENSGEGVPELNGKTVACVGGDFGNEIALSLENLGSQTSEYTCSDDCLFALENNKADFVVTDEITAQRYVNGNKNCKIYDNNYGSVSFCAVFKKNSSLTEKFNDAILHLTENGTIQKIEDAYKNNKPYDLSDVEYEKTLVMAADEFSEEMFFFESYGEYGGIDYDIACEICAFLGYNLQVHTLPFDEAFISADIGEVDFLMSAVTPTRQRTENYDLSDNYFTLNYVLIGK